ncbi:alanine racemase [Romboutsia sp.]|uniref:alanine racemase n=1 Tax=Romboutsia sp. TaxID=1965302 RepID=UPI002CF398C3|nr:alanine racemase [Romboutsia sp.]HSQ87958.1 alanine racemase [Romboutsia sp.]
MYISRPTWVEINIDNLKYNIRQIRGFIGDEVKLAVVLKANAYGHGSIEISNFIKNENIDYICVASLQEALELRYNNIDLPILVMGYVSEDAIKEVIENNITIAIFDKTYGKEIANKCKQINKLCKVHIKIDTGFNRLGFKISGDFEKDKETLKNIIEIIECNNFIIEGIFSHLSLSNKHNDNIQHSKFLYAISELIKVKQIPIKHICDSIAMCKYEKFHMDMVRVGACIYGYNSRSKNLTLKNVMTFKSKIVQIKDIKKGEGISYDSTFIAKKNMKIGIVACGYADGIPRGLSNKGHVVINGKKANIIGNMCMDQCIIDISNLNEEDYKEDVVFYGENGPNLSQLSEIANTNKNEILARVSKRVIKVYINNGEIARIVDELSNKIRY